MKKWLTSLLLLVGLAGSARAETPVVASLSSSAVADIVAVTIDGSGFGVRGDYHPDTDKMIRVYDDWNGVTPGVNRYGSWNAFNYGSGALAVASGASRTGSTTDKYYRRNGNVNLGYIFLTATNQKEYYSTFWMRFYNFRYLSTSGQHKVNRLYSTNAQVNLYPSHGQSDGFNLAFEFLNPMPLRAWCQMNAIPDYPSGWNRMEVYIKKASTSGARDGKYRVWWNNRLVFDWYQRFNVEQPLRGITGDFDNQGADLAGDWALGAYMYQVSGAVDYDDVVYDHSQARVELGNAAVFAQSTHNEYQEPQAWSDTQIKILLKKGTFLSGQTAYLFVIKADGTPSTGVSVIVP